VDDDDRDGTPAGLPASILAAWGQPARTRKGPRPRLTLERIVAAAVTVAGERRAGRGLHEPRRGELGAGPMSLYRYVDAKDELLALMVDAAGGTPPPRPDGELDWRAGLTRWAWGYHDVLIGNPWILRIPIKGPPATPEPGGMARGRAPVAGGHHAHRAGEDVGDPAAERVRP
jgi:hypothetical protein